MGNELDAYNISTVEQEEHVFFGGPLPAYTGPDGFTRHEHRVQGLDAASLALIKRLDLVMKITEGRKSAVDDFAAELLRVLKYETEQAGVRTRMNIGLMMCGEEVFAKTDVCVLDADSGILLLVQEDKPHINSQNPGVSTCGSCHRSTPDELFLGPLEEQAFPGITMSGMFPRFYKIRVTAELHRCVRHGTYRIRLCAATRPAYRDAAAMG